MTEALLVSVRDAAQILGIGRDATYALVRAGTIRSLTVGRRRLVPRAELHAFLQRAITGQIGGETNADQ